MLDVMAMAARGPDGIPGASQAGPCFVMHTRFSGWPAGRSEGTSPAALRATRSLAMSHVTMSRSVPSACGGEPVGAYA
jgi:hypothetical protein